MTPPTLRSPPTLAVRGVRRSFGSRVILDGVDLELAPGECVAILGHSGTGKSTLVRLLCGLDAPDAGSVSSPGRLGVVAQDPALFDFDEMTVGDNLALAGAAPADVPPLLASVGLDPSLAAARPGTLSGGQRRRAAIARALAGGPAALLYDEPTAGLDPATAARIAALIRSTATQRGLASLVITHDHPTAVHVADRVLMLTGGRLVEVLAATEARPGAAPSAPEARDLRELLGSRVDAQLLSPTPSTAPASTGALAPGPTPAGSSPGWTEIVLAPAAATGAAVRLLSGALSIGRDGAIVRRIRQLLPGSAALAMTGCFAVGLVSAAQSAAGLARFDAAHLLPEVATASMVREAIPLLVGLLLAGRIGASIAAETGSLSLSGQLDALRLMGRPPESLLASPLLWAVGFTLPVATALGLLAGLAGVLGGGAGLLGLKTSLVIAGVMRSLRPEDIAVAFAKSVAFGIGIVVSSYRHGAAPIADPLALGQATTRGVVEASVGVVLLDCTITQLLMLT